MPQDLAIEYLDPLLLRPRSCSPRLHSKRQIRQIADSIREFGFLSPILVDAELGIVAGQGKFEAAKMVGMNRVPAVRVEHLTPTQIRAYVIADNKIAENAGWDKELLLLELRELEQDQFDVTLLGFEAVEMDLLFAATGGQKTDAVEPVVRTAPSVSQAGDLWHIGPHRLLCGDAGKTEALDILLGGRKAQCVFTDPPYNVPIDGHVSGLGKIKHPEFAMATGEMTAAVFTDFLSTAFSNLVQHTIDGSIHFVCMDWRHIGEILAAGVASYTELKNVCVWAKSNGGMGSLYRSRHELVFVFKSGTAKHINNVDLGKNGRNRTNVWEYPRVNTFGPERHSELEMHPTVKPVPLVADALLDCSRRGGLILDPFSGSGTTLIAAHKIGRVGFGLELDPYYVDTIIRRFKTVHDLEARLDTSGMTFDEAHHLRNGSAHSTVNVRMHSKPSPSRKRSQGKTHEHA